MLKYDATNKAGAELGRGALIEVPACIVLLCIALFVAAPWPGADPASAQAGPTEPTSYSEPFYPGGTYDTKVPEPAAILGRPAAEPPVRYEELIGYLEALAEASPLVEMVSYGRTHEGRELYYLVVSAREHMDRLDEVRASLARLADPRDLRSDEDVESLISSTPAAAWMAYSIHGDELSSTDAAMQLAYQLAAGTDSLTASLRRNLVIIIDPLQNPDGRERFLSMMQQVEGVTTSWDTQSLEHTGFWSAGRGNHYLFDLNRDWFIQAHPETKGKVKAILDWNPQLFVDSHEMGALDTYLFSPPREPFNPNMTDRMKKWWTVFAEDQANAFDRYGWSYYTREWNEEWFPGYGSSWSLYLGALGILYEQAGVEGSLIKRHDGTYLTYRESVHHQFVSSMANLETAARNKDELLRDYYNEKRRSLRGPQGSRDESFVLVTGDKPDRVETLVAALMHQGIEVMVAEDQVKASGLRDYWGEKRDSARLEAGAYVVSLKQPMGLLAKTLLEFDPRMTDSSLREERYELEKNKRSRIYDVTAWSLPIAMGIECYSATSPLRGKLAPVRAIQGKKGVVRNPDAVYGFIIDGAGDRALAAAAALMEAGYKIRHANKPFRNAGVDFPRGSFLLRAAENPEGLPSALQRICEETGVDAIGVNSALSEKGPDLGGRRFQLLETPRVCLLAGSPASSSSYGALWFLLDHALNMRSSRMDIGRLRRANLDKYNVIVIPEAWGGGIEDVLGDAVKRKLKRWIEEGGTLIAMGSAATALADTSVGLSKVKLRRQVLGELADYEAALELQPSTPVSIDSLLIWEGPPESEDEDEAKSGESANAEGSKSSLKALKTEDERLRTFRPRGAILRVNLDEEHWLASGVGEKVPALTFSSFALMCKEPAEAVGRFADESSMRISGLLWPEGRERWARTAYLTRESLGKGQIVLFLNEPYFRAQYLGTGRLLMNAIVLGPGLGTSRPQPW